MPGFSLDRQYVDYTRKKLGLVYCYQPAWSSRPNLGTGQENHQQGC
jgi:hypothetical protein